MSYIDFLAQASVIQTAIETVLPNLREEYQNPNLTRREVIDTIGSSKLWDRQVELRSGRILGLDEAVGDSLSASLAIEIPRMFKEAQKR